MADKMADKSQHTAGAFDIRNVIGALLVIYGVILTVMGIADDHDNLWTGIGLLAGGAVFVVWALLKPVVVPDPAEE